MVLNLIFVFCESNLFTLLFQVSLPQQIQHQKSPYQYPMDNNENKVTHNGVLTDFRINGYKRNSQCTCVTRQNSVPVSSSQSSSCTCSCCNCSQQPSRAMGLFKSSSCSTLSSVLSHQSRPQLTQFPPRNSKKPVIQCNSADPKLQKTPSCSNLLDKTLQMTKVPVYSDNMVQVYAHLASVIPDEVKASRDGRCAKTLTKQKQLSQNMYDIIRPHSALSSTKSEPARTDTRNDQSNINEISKDTENSRTSRNSYCGSVSKMSCDSDRKSTSSDIYSQVDEVGNTSINSRQSIRERNQKLYSQRPRSVGVVVPSPVYLKSALKKPTHTAMQNGMRCFF